MRAIEPSWPVHNVMRLEDRLATTLAEPRFYTVALTLFAMMAVSTAVLGLYGELSYASSGGGSRSGSGARWAPALLFGVEPLDPASFGLVSAFILTIVLLASWQPMRTALRQEVEG